MGEKDLMSADIDLDAYFERIGYTGPRAPTLETLRAIHLRHAQAIPFENLNPFAGWPVRLDAASLERKLVRERRGGYCYEQNLLLVHALRGLGFQVAGLAARVLWNVPEGTMLPRTHMLVLVDLEERAFVADVGFGGLTLTAPLRLDADVEQATPHEPFRLRRDGDGFVMEARIVEQWKPLYRFDLQEQAQADYEMASWYQCHHPQSRFVTNLIAARPDAGRRYALFNNELAIHHVNGATERRPLTSAVDLGTTLERVFGIRLPDAPEIHAALTRVTSAAALA
jgi:N-hydroxyarylamine O-acetyltransferase